MPEIYKVTLTLRGGKKRETLVSGRTRGEALGQARIAADSVGALSFDMEE